MTAPRDVLPTSRHSRRRILVASAAALVGAAIASAHAEGVPEGLRLKAITVDTSRLERLGLGRGAAVVRSQLGQDLGRVFADRMAPGDASAATLLARVDSLYLASYAGNEFPDRNSSNNDYLEGAGLVVANGQVVSTTPVLSSLAASYSGAWYLPDIDARRVAAICNHFAYWLRREMGI